MGMYPSIMGMGTTGVFMGLSEFMGTDGYNAVR